MLRTETAPHRHVAPARDATPAPVLVATAGTTGAGALRVAHALAARRGVAPVVVSVIDPQPLYGVPFEVVEAPPTLDAARRAARGGDVARQVRRALGADVELPTEIVIGAPAHALAHEVRRRGAALLVVGRGRHDAAARLLREETELAIARRADCPVLAVPEDATEPPRVALVGIDFSALGVAAAQAAVDLLGAGGTLHLVHAWAPLGTDDAWSRDHDARYAARLGERFDRVVDALRVPPGVAVRTEAVEGGVGTRGAADALLARAAAVGADLVAVGRKSHGLVERLLVGSVATGIVRRATTAVLIAPMPSAAVAERLSRHMRGGYEARTAEEWMGLLDRFTQRNAGRIARLERIASAHGVQAQQTGYPLAGAAYDPHDECVQLMFGSPGDAAHLTHVIARPHAVAVVGAETRRDVALRVDDGEGWTLLTFVDAPTA